MTSLQIQAFNSTSGTTISELQTFILTMLFVISCIWAAVMFVGKINSFRKGEDINFVEVVFSGLRVLAILVVILFLVNV